MKSNSNIKSIFLREFMGYFRTPVAYVFLIVFLISANGLTWFVGRLFDSNEASMARFFMFIPWVYLFLVPAVGMRLWAEERRSGTWELLFTLPIRVTDAVLGKFLAAWSFLAIAVVCTLTLPMTVAYLGDPDWSVILSGYLACILMAGAYLAVCSLASAFTRSQVISFVVSLVVCLILVFLGWSIFNEFLLSLHIPNAVKDAIVNVSFIPHFESMTLGLVRIQDLVYFLSMMVVCLSWNVIALKR